MAQVRSGRLDNYCEAIADARGAMAAAKADEAGSIQGALKEMKNRGLSSYKHAGVEMAFVPGADKLRVRLTKDHSDGSSADDAGAIAEDATVGNEEMVTGDDTAEYGGDEAESIN